MSRSPVAGAASLGNLQQSRSVSSYKVPTMDDSTPFRLGEEPLTLEVVGEVARHRRQVVLAGARERMARSRAVVEVIAEGGDGSPSVYGVNTGFGFLADVRISAAEIRDLQRNLVRSHAAGVGAALPTDRKSVVSG